MFKFIYFVCSEVDLPGSSRLLIKHLGFFCFFLVAYVFSICVYITVTIPSLRAIVTPLESEKTQDKVMTLSVLSAGNVIMIGCLLGVLSFQVRRIHLLFKSRLFLFVNSLPLSSRHSRWSCL